MNMKRAGSILCIAATLLLALAGCSSASGPAGRVSPMGAASTGATTPAGGNGMAAKNATANPNVQTCLACDKKIMPTPVLGSVQTSGGAQLIEVAIKGNTYTPNRFTAKAGVPVNVTFTVDGKPAKGCLSKPTFKSLGKSVQITSGSKSVALGNLKPGVYEFTCSMGMNAGRIVVQ
jgi:plastocyanin